MDPEEGREPEEADGGGERGVDQEQEGLREESRENHVQKQRSTYLERGKHGSSENQAEADQLELRFVGQT